MDIKNIIINLEEARFEIDCSIEDKILRLMGENNLTEVTLHRTIPMVLKGEIRHIESIKAFSSITFDLIDLEDMKNEYSCCELGYRFEDTKDYLIADNMIEDSDLFHIPYFELLMVVAETLCPDYKD
jgi:hypothetical protein